MVTEEFARRYAEQWIAAWNAHDLTKILSHYAEEFEMSSPYIVKIMEEASGTLKGKAAVRVYWTKALALMPALRFELKEVLIGVDSITLYYQGVHGMVAEVFFFNAHGQVVKACAHYV